MEVRDQFIPDDGRAPTPAIRKEDLDSLESSLGTSPELRDSYTPRPLSLIPNPLTRTPLQVEP